MLSGAELAEMGDDELKGEVMRTDVFARVSPEHKVRIVDALKRNGQVVAMTGDGVNDAPALKRADIGVAMGITGTDVAKETADMVLTDDNYVSIVSAVEQGRVIYSNIRKFVFYLLSCNLAEIAIIFIATLLGLPSPLTAIQLLVAEPDHRRRPGAGAGPGEGRPGHDGSAAPARTGADHQPLRCRLGSACRRWPSPASRWAPTSSVCAAHPEAPQYAETMAFVTLSFSELLRAFTARSERYPLLRIGLFSNRTMFYAVASSLVLLLLVIYVPFLQPVFNTVPLGLAQWELVLPLLAVPAIVAEITKWASGRWAARVAPAAG